MTLNIPVGLLVVILLQGRGMYILLSTNSAIIQGLLQCSLLCLALLVLSISRAAVRTGVCLQAFDYQLIAQPSNGLLLLTARQRYPYLFQLF